MIFAFLYGISMDYEVFMITRIRESYDETGDTSEAISLGLARTGKLVTSGAGVLMFAFFALSTGPGLDIKLFGIGLAAGVIIDATLIRLAARALVDAAARPLELVAAGLDGEGAAHDPEPARAARSGGGAADRPLSAPTPRRPASAGRPGPVANGSLRAARTRRRCRGRASAARSPGSAPGRARA